MYEPNSDILGVKIDHHNITRMIQSYIIWNGRSHILTEDNLQYIADNIGDAWWLPQEKLTTFRVERDENGELIYFCEMYKVVFDFKLREEVEKVSRRRITTEEANYLFDFFRTALSTFAIQNSDNFYEEVLRNLASVTIVSAKMKQIRDDLLSESDKYMLPDFPIDDATRELWKVYRQELRDLTSQEAFPDDLQNVVMPLAPDTIEQFNQVSNLVAIDKDLITQLGEDFIRSNIDNLLRNFFSTNTKIQVLRAIERTGIPLLTQPGNLSLEELTLFYDNQNEILSNMQTFQLGEDLDGTDISADQTGWQDALDLLNSKITTLNERLSTLNVNFTFQEILDKLLADTQVILEAEQIVDEL